MQAHQYILEKHKNIPAYDLVRACVGRITVGLDMLTIQLKSAGFKKLVKEHLKLDIPGGEAYKITVPFKVGKAKRGAIVIKPEGQDVLDLPTAKLKKLVQGIIWRDEHFDGMSLKDISVREHCSEAYVGTAIFESFRFGNEANIRLF